MLERKSDIRFLRGDFIISSIRNSMGVLQNILSIFVDIQEEKAVFSPQDLTIHYKQEIPHCVIDGVFVAAHYRDIQDILEAYKYRSEREKSKQLVQFLHLLVLSRRKYLP